MTSCVHLFIANTTHSRNAPMGVPHRGGLELRRSDPPHWGKALPYGPNQSQDVPATYRKAGWSFDRRELQLTRGGLGLGRSRPAKRLPSRRGPTTLNLRTAALASITQSLLYFLLIYVLFRSDNR
nr:MAG: hypothetical protein [Cressdnaviricota sp.]